MTKRRLVIAVVALISGILGALLGAFLAPQADRYTVSANVVMVPAPDLTTVEASGFWDVLTRGQVSRTAAIVYADSRWLTSAATAAGVPQSGLTLTAAALPETTMVTVTVTASSSVSAEAALNDVLTTAAPQVASVTAPYQAKVLWPPKGSAVPVPRPSRLQVAAAGALGGLLAGGGAGWLVMRRRGSPAGQVDHPSDRIDEEILPR